MKNTYLWALGVLFLISQFTLAQTAKDTYESKIATVLDNYFELEREAIHLHLDKDTFLNSETVWYQGYIINRKTNKPYFTTNIFVLLFDSKGTRISEKLIYASNGVFSGKIILNSKLDSGNYYIQVYTNWMNNFNENESTIRKITVINPEQGLKSYSKINTDSLQIALNPEGKSFIKDVSNTIGVQVKDCRGNAPENLEANVINSSGEIIKTIKLNRFGYGKFEIIPSDDDLKVSVSYGDKTIEKLLPNANPIGVSIDVNTFSIENKTLIKIKTNKASTDVFQSQKLNLVIHQDQKLVIYPLEFKSNEYEKTLQINNSDLHEGINTIRIIDNNLKQWSERLIYINTPLTESLFNVMKTQRKEDKIGFIGYSNYSKAIMSVSVLPENTKGLDDDNSIIAGITLNPYLSSPLKHANYYFTNQSRLKAYELDLALLNDGKSKYDWDFMKVSPPTANYSFDIGITVKGYADATLKDKSAYKVNLVTYKDYIIQSTDVSDKGEYKFENLLLTDSTLVNLSMVKPPSTEELKTKLVPQILNRKRSFNKPFVPEQDCNSDDYEKISNFDLPKLDEKIINLDNVVIKTKDASQQLVHDKILSNSMLKGFKIDQSNNHGSLLNFIEYNGFNVQRDEGSIKITVRQKTSLNLANQSPVVYVNDRMLFGGSYAEIEFMKMTDIDEIYIDDHAVVASINNNHGVIKIYTKRAKNGYFDKPNPNSFFIKEAFSDAVSFKNDNYENTQSQGFDNFGILGWSPIVTSTEEGNFLFDVTDLNKSKSKIIVEGMTPDGKLFREEKIVELK